MCVLPSEPCVHWRSWTGDRWQFGWNGTGAPRPGRNGWDYQTWLPLRWDDAAQPPVPRPLRWLDSFEL